MHTGTISRRVAGRSYCLRPPLTFSNPRQWTLYDRRMPMRFSTGAMHRFVYTHRQDYTFIGDSWPR